MNADPTWRIPSVDASRREIQDEALGRTKPKDQMTAGNLCYAPQKALTIKEAIVGSMPNKLATEPGSKRNEHVKLN
ncbi:hypothetical protein Acr_09g0002110 [Actinidia rufa]|uniref:Uncharacterized protein n=1 Tax=Actinidia rufa TaxID=165716 RepID=A0A7J0F4Z6_9ERIC|nr:hypothetical protein Acr_09g0002110 [Actinidia rufa]